MSRGSPRSQSRSQAGGSSGCRSRVAEIQRARCSAPERFRRLTRAQLAAVPDDRGPRAASRGGLRRSLHGLAALRRERAPRIDIRPDRVAVMNEKQVQSLHGAESRG